jgi:microcystin degradation protein MlrC
MGITKMLMVLYDPRAAAQCVASGVGNKLTLDVGARMEPRLGNPVRLTGRVRTISDGRFEDLTPTHGGKRFFDAGTSVVFESDAGCTLVLTSKRLMPTSIEQLRSLGLKPERFVAIVAKGMISPKQAYEPIAAQVIPVDTPGPHMADITKLSYLHRRRPLFPFEAEARYP